MALTLETSKKFSSKKIAVPTPRPKLEESKVESGANQQANRSNQQVDQAKLSGEARSGELGAASNSPVNFGAWDDPSPVGDNKVSETSAAGGDLGSKTLRQGMRSDEVKALQEKLKSSGVEIGVDGIFGKDTLKAVQDFQKSQGLDVDGLVGKDTRKALEGLGAGGADKAGADKAGTEKAEGGVEAPVKAEEAAAKAEDAAVKAGEQAANAGQETGEQSKAEGAQEQAGTQEAGESEKAESKVPGTEDTSWTEKLPKGLKQHAQAFIDAGKKHGVDPRFLAAISSQETGGGTSKAIKNKNNAMGIMKGKKLKSFASVADSINAQARSLTRDGGYYTGKNTIAKIGGTYAPVGAANDPNGLNKHWIPNITKFYEELGGDASGKVKGF